MVLLVSTAAMAQNNIIKAVLQDESTGNPVDFATVSLTKEGSSKPDKYVLSDSNGKVEFTGVHAGTYKLKAELMGYKAYETVIKIPEQKFLGVIKMTPDREQLEAASVSAVGNPIIIKKDTIEYNASSFKTTDNDVLEDLLKKLPGFDVSDDGSITINGKTVNKITIDGKTFFLDDPQLASKNIPAKVISKLKVIDKKSDQAEFTGIDDGEEETVIDLSVRPGMMKGTFGNIMGGAGHDIPSTDVEGDWRYQGAAFVGNFTDKTQLSLIANANNTNNRGFNDLSGSMMGNMRGGGGGFGGGGGMGGWGGNNGITTSYMGGVNGAWTLFDNKMDLSSNYLYNNTDKYVEEQSSRTTYLQDYDQIYNTQGINDTKSWGHRVGARLEHKFSENTSIIFQPQINFGGGHYDQISEYNTDYDRNGTIDKINKGNTNNSGDNKNFNASGFALLRQRLGKPGRTLTVMGRYSFSNNDLNSLNNSNVYSDYISGDEWGTKQVTFQNIDQNSYSHSLFGRVTYTEPLGEGFFVEANYGYNWSRSTSRKNTYNVDPDDHTKQEFDPYYSNSVINDSKRHDIGANFLYQNDKFRAQVGISLQPTTTHNETNRSGQQLPDYDDTRWRWAPSGMLWWEMGEDANMRIFYRGSSNQPSVSQLIPVPDNTNPLQVSFGNPYLAPYFSHSVNGEYRFNNKKTFASVSARFNGSYVQDPITTATWYGPNGAAYSMPFNGPDSYNFGGNVFANMPLGQSNFTISNMSRVSYSTSASYVGGSDVTSVIGNYYDATTGDMDYSGFNSDYLAGKFSFDENIIRTFSATERLRVVYRNDNLELSMSGRTRMNKSWYTIKENADNTMTFNNQLTAGVNWTWSEPGITVKSDYNFNWYDGYSSELNYTPEHILNAEIQKLLFKNTMTIALKGYDILGQAKNLSVTDNNNYHSEVINNTLGRYIILSLTWRFGTFDRSKMRGPGGGPGGRGFGGPPPGMR
ncbi:MAG: outer membrane beta-barrel protein [Bacteroidales bacterium]|nr:outer membrane beta-barrel protein [Bacteroidales bacterium]